MKQLFISITNISIQLSIVLFLMCINTTTSFAQGSPILMEMDLLKFEGENKGAYIQLFWSERVPSQDNYLVERAGEDGIFSTIGISNMQSDFLDKTPLDKTNYYRLALDNNTGEVVYSNVIAVEHEIQKEIQLMPNPATDHISLRFFVQPNSESSIIIMNQQGSVISEQRVKDPIGGVQDVAIDLQDYAAGVYLLRISDGDITRIRKFVVSQY